MIDLVDVRFLGLPIEQHRDAAQHIDELLREFFHIDAGSGEIPQRLLQLRDDLQARFSAFAAEPRAELAAAIERGDTSIDLNYRLPVAAGEVAGLAVALLDEADEYCRKGEHLLTLAAPEGAVRYRRWFFGEFTRQCAGEPPTPWPRYDG